MSFRNLRHLNYDSGNVIALLWVSIPDTTVETGLELELFSKVLITSLYWYSGRQRWNRVRIFDPRPDLTRPGR